MPVVYSCKNCGYILYVFWRVGQDSYGVPTPSELISIYGGVCPRCGHRLEKPGLDDVEVVASREPVAERVRLLRGLLASERRGGVVVTARMTVDLAEVLDSVAERLGVSRSEALRLAVARLAGEINGSA